MKQKTLTIYLDREIHKRFRDHCYNLDVSMTKKIVDLINNELMKGVGGK